MVINNLGRGMYFGNGYSCHDLDIENLSNLPPNFNSTLNPF
jgi:hypothetical protein